LPLLTLVGCNLDLVKGPEILSFTVIDSYQVSSEIGGRDEALGINAGINVGQFTASWSVDSNSYYVQLALSRDSMGTESIRFFNTHGTQTLTTMTCRFTGALKMSCGEIGPNFPLNPEIDVSPLITALPMHAWLLLSVCDNEIYECDTRYQKVWLQ
jgi:hypothetical protein